MEKKVENMDKATYYAKFQTVRDLIDNSAETYG